MESPREPHLTLTESKELPHLKRTCYEAFSQSDVMRLSLLQRRVPGSSSGSRKKRAVLGCPVCKDMSAEIMSQFMKPYNNIRARRPFGAGCKGLFSKADSFSQERFLSRK